MDKKFDNTLELFFDSYVTFILENFLKTKYPIYRNMVFRANDNQDYAEATDYIGHLIDKSGSSCNIRIGSRIRTEKGPRGSNKWINDFTSSYPTEYQRLLQYEVKYYFYGRLKQFNEKSDYEKSLKTINIYGKEIDYPILDCWFILNLNNLISQIAFDPLKLKEMNFERITKLNNTDAIAFDLTEFRNPKLPVIELANFKIGDLNHPIISI